MEASFGRTPHPEALGYQAALDAGFAIVETGSSEAALPYFERAARLRPTSIALTQAGKCLRDLGRSDDALIAYRRAVMASGGTGPARVALVSLLVELRLFAEAVPLAQTAASEEPQNPAVLNVLASCFEGLVALERETLTPEQRAQLTGEVRRLRVSAQALQPESREAWLRRRQARTFPLHSIAPIPAVPAVPVEQSSETAMALSHDDPGRGVGTPPDGTVKEGPPSASDDRESSCRDSSRTHAAVVHSERRIVRWLRLLWGRSGPAAAGERPTSFDTTR